VGGWAVPYRRLGPMSKTVVSYPLGRLDVYEDRLVFRARGPLASLVRQRVVPLAAITRVERKRGQVGRPSGVRIYHDAGRTDWAAHGRESEAWLAQFVEERLQQR
jgi:hypothetical protein